MELIHETSHMRQTTTSLLFILLATGSVMAQDDFFSRADQFFKKYQINNRINYKFLDQNVGTLDTLVSLIDGMRTDTLDQVTRKAFYVNAYNLLVIKGVIDHYPFSNMLEVPGFFKTQKFNVAGERLTLDEIEFTKLFADEIDPRLHFVLNCGAYSCPTLYNEAIKPSEMEEQLNFAITLVMDRDDYVYIDRENRTIWVSKIFEWYKEHFEDNGSIRNFINYHRFTSVPSNFGIKFLEYDWRLNDSNNTASE